MIHRVSSKGFCPWSEVLVGDNVSGTVIVQYAPPSVCECVARGRDARLVWTSDVLVEYPLAGQLTEPFDDGVPLLLCRRKDVHLR